jgi:hypothetical protein
MTWASMGPDEEPLTLLVQQSIANQKDIIARPVGKRTPLPSKLDLKPTDDTRVHGSFLDMVARKLERRPMEQMETPNHLQGTTETL